METLRVALEGEESILVDDLLCLRRINWWSMVLSRFLAPWLPRLLEKSKVTRDLLKHHAQGRAAAAVLVLLVILSSTKCL
mmetsp:Transcript_18808/g.28639  ORF Transcript_18808/g.28639 Transcript_18808/m.28639 type:complete len:80 (+) Transcript_18808:43-282(+)